jgi:hypothetical protein
MMGYLQEDDLKIAGKSLQGQKEGYNIDLMLFTQKAYVKMSFRF